MENKIKLYKKLHDIQTAVKGLSKDKKSYSFSYVTGNKLLSFVKPLMEQKQILLKQEVLSIDNDRIDYSTKNGNKSEILTKVMMRFTWIDCETGETDINLFGANGQNGFEMGLGSALTYAERYFILKYFHISTDEDDIDNPERKKTAITIEKPKLKLTKAGLDYLTTKGTKEEIQKALDERIITEVQKTALETTLTTKK